MKLVEQINSGRIIISDGAMGTALQNQGMPAGTCPEMMNINMPDVVRGIAVDYINAGARIIETNTFGANRFILSKYGLADRIHEINTAGVRLAKEAAKEASVDETDILVFASLGPSGVFLEPLGDVTELELASAVKEQVTAFRDAGADGVIVETMSDLTEARITVETVKGFGLECIALMCFSPTPKGYFTMMGVTIEQSVEVLINAGADVIGAGCGVGCSDMISIAKEFRAHTNHPLAIHPNAGSPELRDGEVYYPESPQAFADTAKQLVEISVNVIGGCCGTTPAHIAAIGESVSDYV